MYLVDTNFFLEALLEQEKTDVSLSFFQSVELDDMYITDLALHSIGIILFKLEKYELYTSFVNDMLKNGMNIVSLDTDELSKLDIVVREFNLDFDDA